MRFNSVKRICVKRERERGKESRWYDCSLLGNRVHGEGCEFCRSCLFVLFIYAAFFYLPFLTRDHVHELTDDCSSFMESLGRRFYFYFSIWFLLVQIGFSLCNPAQPEPDLDLIQLEERNTCSDLSKYCIGLILPANLHMIAWNGEVHLEIAFYMLKKFSYQSCFLYSIWWFPRLLLHLINKNYTLMPWNKMYLSEVRVHKINYLVAEF